ncbi:MAG: succinate dehydrogenase assembly factor 2 [Steroidobacteraceae bacterium]
MADATLARVQWRCRRGTRELDLLLGRWLEHCWSSAGSGQRQAFQRLLDQPDPDLTAWLIGGSRPADRSLAAIVDDIVRNRD